MDELKSIITKYCYKKDGSINGCCNNKVWWQSRGLETYYHQTFEVTSFLPENTKINIRFYHILNDVWHTPKCLAVNCDKTVTWHKSINRYSLYCSRRCTSIANIKTGKENHFSKSETKEKIKQTLLQKYNVDNYSKSTEFSDKMKKYYSCLTEDDKKYIQSKRENTNLRKYGYTTPLLSKTVQEKTKNTLLDRYGVDSPSKSKIIQAKKVNTNLQRYKVPNYNQQHLGEETINNLCDRKWLEKKMAQSSIKEIAAKLNISYSALCSHIRKAGIILTNYSYFETEVYNYIKEIRPDIEVIRRDKTLLKTTKQEIDLYIPELRLAIECNGIYWHGENKGKHKYYHLGKTESCLQSSVRLIHIFENEWAGKQDIVKNRLSVLLGQKTKIYGRNTIVKKVAKTEEQQFLDANHLQGYVPSVVCYGLYHNDVLISLMSFGKSRFSKNIEWELLRYTVKDIYCILGGAKKLFSSFINDFSPKSIVSYSDRRWFTGELYKELGFSFSHYSSPNYYYVEQNGELSSRLRYQKHKLSKILSNYNPYLTEWENMLCHGYDRIWDCGNSVWFYPR